MDIDIEQDYHSGLCVCVFECAFVYDAMCACICGYNLRNLFLIRRRERMRIGSLIHDTNEINSLKLRSASFYRSGDEKNRKINANKSRWDLHLPMKKKTFAFDKLALATNKKNGSDQRLTHKRTKWFFEHFA